MLSMVDRAANRDPYNNMFVALIDSGMPTTNLLLSGGRRFDMLTIKPTIHVKQQNTCAVRRGVRKGACTCSD